MVVSMETNVGSGDSGIVLVVSGCCGFDGSRPGRRRLQGL